VQVAHPVSLRDRRPDELQLADAQHVIAREYGFASWPRLVEYFEETERHRNGPRHNSDDDDLEQLEARARRVIRRHQRGDPILARELGRAGRARERLTRLAGGSHLEKRERSVGSRAAPDTRA